MTLLIDLPPEIQVLLRHSIQLLHLYNQNHRVLDIYSEYNIRKRIWEIIIL